MFLARFRRFCCFLLRPVVVMFLMASCFAHEHHSRTASFFALYQSAEYQTSAALMILDSKDDLLARKQTIKGIQFTNLSQKNIGMNKRFNRDKILREQLKSLRKTHDGMNILVSSLWKGQYVEDHGERDEDSNLKIEQLTQKVSELRDEIKSLQEENDELKQRLKDKDLSSNTKNLPSVSNQDDVEEMELDTLEEEDCIQMLCRQHETHGLTDKLSNMLKSKYAPKGKLLNVEIIKDQSAVNVNDQLLVLCIASSRLGSDVESALKGLSLNKRIGLVVMHVKAPHNPATEPSEKLLSSTFQRGRPGKIFDMAFLPELGIYKCAMNKKAVEDIVGFIQSKH